jgi:putative ABC transport system permease protein
MESEQAIMTDPAAFGIVYISETLAKQMSGISGANEVLILYNEAADEDAIIKSIENQLGHYGLKQIIKRKDQMSNVVVQMEVDQLARMSAAVPVIFLLVAALVLVMMLGRKIKRDRIIIGIMKAMGYGNRDIIAHYTKYAAVTGFLGGLLGAVLGMISAGGIAKLFVVYFNIPMLRVEFFPSVVFQAIVGAVFFCTIAGMIGSRDVLKILPADSMKSESPKIGRRTFLEKIPFLWKRFTFSQKLTIKSIFRNKKRGAFVVVGISLSYAMMLFTTSMPEAIDNLMLNHYQEFQRMDYNVGFRYPVKESAINDLRHVIDIKHMEGKLEYPFEFEIANRTQIVSIIGVSKDTEFYTFRNTDDRVVPLPRSGILLSENLADNLRLKPGDTVKLNSFIPGRPGVYVEVRDVIKQALGLNAYMEIGFMSETQIKKNAVNGVYINSNDDKIYEKLAKVSGVASVMSVEDTMAMFEDYMGIMLAAISFMVVFSGILGFCIVYNATTIIIGEREPEFSALRVLGLSKNEIFRMVLNENNVLMITGILLGIPLGMWLLSTMATMVSTDLYTFYLTASPGAVATAALLTALFVVFAQLATFRKIRRLDLLAVLKNRMS